MADSAAQPDHAQLEIRVNRFLRHEGHLLDTRQWDQWLDLFESDGHYWVPTSADQTDAICQPSLAYEDNLLLQIRIHRLRHPQAHSQKPASCCQHVLQQAQVQVQSGARVITRTPFTYVESRDGRQLWLTGVAIHTLTDHDNRFSIAQKRIDLLDPGAALPMIQLFI